MTKPLLLANNVDPATPRRAIQSMRYIDPLLAAYVGETVLLRYDPRDMAEVRLFHQGKFLCRAICPEDPPWWVIQRGSSKTAPGVARCNVVSISIGFLAVVGEGLQRGWQEWLSGEGPSPSWR